MICPNPDKAIINSLSSFTVLAQTKIGIFSQKRKILRRGLFSICQSIYARAEQILAKCWFNIGMVKLVNF